MADGTASLTGRVGGTGAPRGGQVTIAEAWPTRLGLAVTLIALSLVVLSGPGTQMGWWTWRTGLAVLKWGVYATAAAAVIALGVLVAAWERGDRAATFRLGAWLVLMLVILAVPLTYALAARHVPMLHDVSTDTEDPPRFVVLAPVRESSDNGLRLPTSTEVAVQKAAYPELQPLVSTRPPDVTFSRALDAARSLGWTIAAAVPAEGRIEATASTLWFGFKDDVVIRIRPHPSGARVDMRSASRVGRSDIGMNARRIRNFLERLQGTLYP